MEERKGFQIPGIRYLFSTAGFLGFCTIYAIRVNINVAIVAMVNGTAVYKSGNTSTSDECKVTPPPFADNSSLYEVPQEGEFIWSPQLQAVVLGAFYYGYCISQIPGGRLAEIFSAKWVFGIGTFITALLTLLTPAAARLGVGVLIGIRALEGLAQGVTMPAMHSMLGRWLPDSERAFLSTLVYCGINVGTVSAMPVSGILCNSDIFGGWPSAFYFVGIFGCCWFLLWSVIVTETPFTHPWITNEELKYITSNQKIEMKDELPPIPWFKIMTSVPFLAVIFTQIGADWAFYTLVNDLPTFFATMLHFNVAKNGFLSSFPHLLQTFFGLSAGFLADFMVQRNLASTNFVRKFFNSVWAFLGGMFYFLPNDDIIRKDIETPSELLLVMTGFGPALSLIAVCLAGCDVTLNVIFFTLSLSLGGFCYSGYMLSHLDLSPEYAGTLMGIANTISNLTGFLAPLVVGALTETQQTLHEWRIVFGISSALLMSTSFIFLFFSSTKKQDWAERSPENRILINTSKISLDGRTGYDSIQC